MTELGLLKHFDYFVHATPPKIYLGSTIKTHPYLLSEGVAPISGTVTGLETQTLFETRSIFCEPLFNWVSYVNAKGKKAATLLGALSVTNPDSIIPHAQLGEVVRVDNPANEDYNLSGDIQKIWMKKGELMYRVRSTELKDRMNVIFASMSASNRLDYDPLGPFRLFVQARKRACGDTFTATEWHSEFRKSAYAASLLMRILAEGKMSTLYNLQDNETFDTKAKDTTLGH